MTKAQLMASLFDYRKLCARIDVLGCRIREAERRYSIRGDISGSALPSPRLTGMPGAKGGVSRPTERLALELMRFPSERARLEIAADLREMEALVSQKRRLDVLISGLGERERFVVTAHLIGSLRWRETARRFAREFGEELSESALKYVMRRALDDMLEALEPAAACGTEAERAQWAKQRGEAWEIARSGASRDYASFPERYRQAERGESQGASEARDYASSPELEPSAAGAGKQAE